MERVSHLALWSPGHEKPTVDIHARHWSKLYHDGKIIWGPDPELTPKGITQAEAARQLWQAEHKYGLPLPDKHYASPMRRALRTWHEIFVNSNILEPDQRRVTILEVCFCREPHCTVCRSSLQNLREEYGEHTCDLRSPRSVIAQTFPPPIYEFEEGFAEEDVIWKPDERETKEHVKERAKAVLDRIFAQDEGTCA